MLFFGILSQKKKKKKKKKKIFYKKKKKKKKKKKTLCLKEKQYSVKLYDFSLIILFQIDIYFI